VLVALIGWWTGWATHDSASGGSGSGSGAGTCAVTSVAERALPSVVTITARTSAGSGTGSGVVVRLPGVSGSVVITNEHVVHPGGGTGGTATPALQLAYADGSTASGKLLGADALTDLAVVQPAQDAPDAPAMAIGRSARLRVGQPVVALGAPLGLSSTVTSGIVSAKDRYVRVPSQSGSSHHLLDAIQTDAAINPGNSGGALTDCGSRLIGINAAGASPGGESGSAGLNFAIPVDLAVPTAQQLAKSGSVTRPTLGLETQAVRSLTDTNAEARLQVQSVDPDGPGVQAGIQPGDVLLTVDGAPVHSPDDLAQLELQSESGDTVKVTLLRDGKQVSTQVAMR
jgi:putative serine protease PepD